MEKDYFVTWGVQGLPVMGTIWEAAHTPARGPQGHALQDLIVEDVWKQNALLKSPDMIGIFSIVEMPEHALVHRADPRDSRRRPGRVNSKPRPQAGASISRVFRAATGGKPEPKADNDSAAANGPACAPLTPRASQYTISGR
jgi:hypothetical protein